MHGGRQTDLKRQQVDLPLHDLNVQLVHGQFPEEVRAHGLAQQVLVQSFHGQVCQPPQTVHGGDGRRSDTPKTARAGLLTGMLRCVSRAVSAAILAESVRVSREYSILCH